MPGRLPVTVVPSLLKIKLGVNEIISTLLLNYIAFLVALNQVYGAWQDPNERFPHSEKFDPVEQLPSWAGRRSMSAWCSPW